MFSVAVALATAYKVLDDQPIVLTSNSYKVIKQNDIQKDRFQNICLDDTFKVAASAHTKTLDV